MEGDAADALWRRDPVICSGQRRVRCPRHSATTMRHCSSASVSLKSNASTCFFCGVVVGGGGGGGDGDVCVVAFVVVMYVVVYVVVVALFKNEGGRAYMTCIARM